MLKVLQIANKAPYPPNDGSSIAIYNMAKGLIENGVELHLLTMNTKKHFKDDALVPEEFKKLSHYQSVYKNTNTGIFGALINLLSHQSYFVSRFRFASFESKLKKILIGQTFDIIQLEGLFVAVYLDTIRKYSKAKVVLRAHNIEHFIWNRHVLIEKNKIKKAYFKIQNNRLREFELRVLSEVDAVVPITRIDTEEIIKLGCKLPIYTCITGVDFKDYQNNKAITEKSKTVFYFGSMDWMPNQEAVIWFLTNCWDKIQLEVPEARFVIAGRGMPLSFFKINKPNVLVIENVLDGKGFYKQYQVMVVPLWSGSGLRIKIIEGMAYGKSIVSTSIGAEGINCIHGKNILIADNANDFIEQVIALLNNDQLRHNLEKNATELAAKEFDNHLVVSSLIEFYKELR